MQNWRKNHPDTNFYMYIRPYVIDDSSTAANKEGKIEDGTAKQSQKASFLWIDQNKWQKHSSEVWKHHVPN